MPDRLANYIPVAERVAEATPDIQHVTSDQPVMLTDVMGYIRVTVVLKDNTSATGIASFRLDLQGKSAQATNPIEDGETSAVGRALGFLGYSSSRSIATREEVQEAQRRANTVPEQSTPTMRNPDAPATDKQLGMLGSLRDELGWTKAQAIAFMRERGMDISVLTKAQASTLIEAFQNEIKLYRQEAERPAQPSLSDEYDEIERTEKHNGAVAGVTK